MPIPPTMRVCMCLLLLYVGFEENENFFSSIAREHSRHIAELSLYRLERLKTFLIATKIEIRELSKRRLVDQAGLASLGDKETPDISQGGHTDFKSKTEEGNLNNILYTFKCMAEILICVKTLTALYIHCREFWLSKAKLF